MPSIKLVLDIYTFFAVVAFYDMASVLSRIENAQHTHEQDWLFVDVCCQRERFKVEKVSRVGFSHTVLKVEWCDTVCLFVKI